MGESSAIGVVDILKSYRKFRWLEFVGKGVKKVQGLRYSMIIYGRSSREWNEVLIVALLLKDYYCRGG